MTQQQEVISYSGEFEPAGVFLSPLLLSKLTEASHTSPNEIAVMLALVSNINRQGAVKVSQDNIAELCNISIKTLKKSILGLADAGLISSVEMGSAPDETIVCRVSTELVSCSKPEDPTVLLPTPQETNKS